MTTTPGNTTLATAQTTRPIQAFTGPLDEAHAKSQADLEPLFVPQSVFADDRGWSLMNQFVGVLSDQGQINYSVMYPSVIKAWHRHHKQTDFWLCLHGHLKVGVHNQDTGQSWVKVIGDKAPGVVVIPPPLWHGAATVGPENAGLLYFVTHQYDASAPDEDRLDWDGVAGFPWGVEFK